MRYRLRQLKLKPGDGTGALERVVHDRVAKVIGGRAAEAPCGGAAAGRENLQISNIEIRRKSIDARKKPDVRIVYTVDFDSNISLPLEIAKEEEYTLEIRGKLDTGRPRPIIAGFGPCGIFAALILAEAGLEPLVVERGKAVEERIKDVELFHSGESPAANPESNVQFGEGGAGTFSDGKLTSGIKDIRIRKVLRTFVDAGADSEILYTAKPHIGTDRLRELIPKIRKRIEALGGQIMFSTKLTALLTDSSKDRLRALELTDNITGAKEKINTDTLILAIGHSARDTFKMLRDSGVEMRRKAFSIGIRVEHTQEMINRAQYGDPKLADILGAADYKLSHKCANGRGVYTFCMCPGGTVIDASTEPESHVTNGMSNSARDGLMANSAVLADVRIEDYAYMGDPEYRGEDPLAGIEFQRKYERLAWEKRAFSNYGKFMRDSSDPVRMSLPAFAAEAIAEAMPVFGRKLNGFDREDTLLTAVESRSSSPVRIVRDKSMQASVRGLIPAGEGPGYAGGIVSAAVDGIRAAEQVIKDREVR